MVLLVGFGRVLVISLVWFAAFFFFCVLGVLLLLPFVQSRCIVFELRNFEEGPTFASPSLGEHEGKKLFSWTVVFFDVSCDQEQTKLSSPHSSWIQMAPLLNTFGIGFTNILKTAVFPELKLGQFPRIRHRRRTRHWLRSIEF